MPSHGDTALSFFLRVQDTRGAGQGGRSDRPSLLDGACVEYVLTTRLQGQDPERNAAQGPGWGGPGQPCAEGQRGPWGALLPGAPPARTRPPLRALWLRSRDGG